MGYTAVKGGATAIEAAEELVRLLPLALNEQQVELHQIRNQFGAAIDKVMSEGGVYAPDLAALAIRQTEGDLFEAAFILRAYRSTLPRLGYSLPVTGREMRVVRRISSAFRDIPGGQLLGRTRDYTQRLLDFSQLAGSNGRPRSLADFDPQQDSDAPLPELDGRMPKVSDVMRAMGVMPPVPATDPNAEPFDITRESVRFPVSRPAWLQAMARGESGALVCLAYTSLRGFGGRADHGTIGELRVGDLPLRVTHPVTGEPVSIGKLRVTEVEMVGNERHAYSPGTKLPSFGLSYGLVFGQHERKAIAMALLDSSLQAAAISPDGELGPANDQEMVLYHIDGIESFGFVEHLKLPHFVTFGSDLQATLQKLRNGTSVNGAEAVNGVNGVHAVNGAHAAANGAVSHGTDGDHDGIEPGQLHSHGGGEPHSHDD